MLKGEKIICISDLTWGSHRVCEQSMMQIFAEFNNVLYIERPVSFMTPFTRWGRGKTLKQLKRWIQGGIRNEEGLLVASPPPFLPLRFSFLVNIINQNIMLAWIRHLIKKYDMGQAFIITFEPDSAPLCNKLDEKLFIYYCNDDHEAKGFWWNKRQSIIKKESNLIRKSDLVLCLTEGFARTRRKYNGRVYVVPNAIDESYINVCLIQQPEIQQDMKRIKRPIIGFFGMIDSRLDIQLLIYLAKRKCDWSFVLVGMIKGKLSNNFAELCNLENVYYLGSKPRTEIISYINAMDVCLIPVIISDRTRNVLSIKLFEYTALGKPIVSTNLPELRRYAKYVKISRNRDEFFDNINDSLKNVSSKLSQEAVAFASQNTWRHRAEMISKIINSHVPE